MSLLPCICIFLVFVEFQSSVDGRGMSFVGEIICSQASQTWCGSTLNLAYKKSIEKLCGTFFQKLVDYVRGYQQQFF